MATDPLLQPYRLRHLELKNRVISTAHEPAYSENGLPLERYRRYHEEKAKGGLAMTMFGGSTLVARDSPPAFGNLDASSDAIIPHLRRLAETVHAHDCAIMCQLTHLGRRSSNYTADWLPLIAPSAVREPAHRAFPKAMEDWDIERVVRAYGGAAVRCREGGLDGIELEAYGHLLDAFWSPLTNHRDDEYGGSLDNRMRFSLEVIDHIRARVGGDWIVGIRMVLDETVPGGIGEAEGLQIARRLVDGGGIDFINVIRGHIETDEALSHVIPNMGQPSAPHLEFAGMVRRTLGVPVMHAARINDTATARHAIRDGLVDLVGMTRAHMADPCIVAKIRRGEEHRIRPCVGAGYCIDRIYEGGEALCLHNPATGRESLLPQVITSRAGESRRAVVVGAGPAGLEAARVLASRGHRVTVLEAADAPGGQLRLAARLARRAEILGISDWLYAECGLLGVDFRFDCLADGDEVRRLEPDLVIVATGGIPNVPPLGAGADLVTTSWDVLSGQVQPAARILLFDDNGQHPGMTCAEYLAVAGARLEYVTPERSIAPDIGGTNYPAYLRAMLEHDVDLTLCHRLAAVRRDHGALVATLVNDFTPAAVERVVDQVVVEHGTLPVDDLYFDLRLDSWNHGEVDIEALVALKPQKAVRDPEGPFQLFRIGDAVASRNVHAAIHDAMRLCLAL